MPRPTTAPIGTVVARTAKVLDRAFDDRLVEAGGSRPQWLILMALKAEPHASQREIADAIGIQGATLTHHLDAMEADGLLTRRRDPANRRVHIVELTAAGESRFGQLLGTVVAFDRQLRRGVTRDDLALVEAILARLEANVHAGGG